MMRAARGEVEGEVETPKPLDQDQLADLEKAASQTFGKRVSLSMRINPDLIGGVRVRVGNTLYDGSIETALEELERRLMEAPVP